MELYLQHYLNANVHILGHEQFLSHHSMLRAPVFNNKIWGPSVTGKSWTCIRIL